MASDKLIADIANEEMRLIECHLAALEAGDEEQADHFNTLANFMRVYNCHLITGKLQALEFEMAQLSLSSLSSALPVAKKFVELAKAGLIDTQKQASVHKALKDRMAVKFAEFGIKL